MRQSWWAQQEATSSFKPHGKGHRVGDTISMTSRIVSIVITLMGVFIVFVLGLWTLSGASAYAIRGPYGSTMNMPNTPAIMSGCGSIYEFRPTIELGTFNHDDITPVGKNKDRVRVPTAPMLVPAYGYMSEEGIPDGRNFYTAKDDDLPPLTKILRSMYDGRIILWYEPDSVRGAGLDNLRAWTENYPEVVIIPWVPSTLGIFENLQGHNMPMGRSYAFSAWNVTQSCDVFHPKAADGFMNFVNSLNGENIPSDSPPPAIINEKGQLPDIPFQGSDIT